MPTEDWQMTVEQLKNEEDAIRECVSRSYVDPSGAALPIYDGVVNPSVYLAATTRILWILKEPCDEDDRSGGGWSLTEHLLNQRPFEMAKGPTFRPIIYVVYGILNRIQHYADIPRISAANQMALLLRSIAFINAKKLPGLKRSRNEEILETYRASRELILKQIHTYDPNYILGCRPHMSVIMQDLGAKQDDIETHNNVRYFRLAGNCLLLEVFHPAQTTIRREQYVNDILHVVALAGPEVLNAN